MVAKSYLLGVSSRRVEKLVEQLGVKQLSKSQVSEMATHLDAQVEAFRNRPLDAAHYPFVWMDRLTMKVREHGRTVNVHALVAVGVNAGGQREVLGVDVASDEDGAGWLAFLRSLTARALSGVQLVISDAHRGLVGAIGAALPGAAWQRCRTHYLRNLLTKVPKSAQPWIATLVRTIFDQPDSDAVRAQFDRVVATIEAKFPAAAEHLDAARDDLLAFTGFPREIWRQIWSNNPQERLNKERRESHVPVAEGTCWVKATATRPKIMVTGGGRGVVGHVGARLLADLADATGLTSVFGGVLAGLRARPGPDRRRSGGAARRRRRGHR